MSLFSRELLYKSIKKDIAKVVCSDFTTWYLTKDGDLYGCGYNGYGQQGSGNTSNVLIFTKRASNVKDVACSGYTVWYIDNNGNLYGCGYNSSGQQGSGLTSDVLTFTKRASNVSQVVCLDSSGTTWYIKNNGDLYGCGRNDYGQQGDDSTSNVLTFTKRASNVSQVTCSKISGHTTWYINSNGDLYGCGRGDMGQHGNGNTYNVLIFVKRASNVSQVTCSDYTTWYLTRDGDLYGCGRNEEGQQGGGGLPNVTSFSKRASNVSQVACSRYTTWYVTKEGDLYGCGENYNGQQGSGSNSDATTFIKRASNVLRVVCSYNTTWYIDNNNDLYGCGNNNRGQQGSGTTSDVLTFTKRAENVKDVVCSPYTTWYLDIDGNLHGCGYNNYGQQGNGSTDNQLIFENKMSYIIPSYTLNVVAPQGTTCTIELDGENYNTNTITARKGSEVFIHLYHSTYGTYDGYYVIDSDETLTFTASPIERYRLDSDITGYGSPTITSDGIISGLSTSNRLGYNTDNLSRTNWQYHVKFKCNSITSNSQAVIGRKSNSYNEYGFRVLIDKNGYLYVTSYNGSKLILTSGTYQMLGAGWCWVDAYYKNNKLHAELYRESTNTIEVFYDATVATQTSLQNAQYIGCQTYASSSTTWSRHYGATGCMVDLKDFYIKSDDEYYIHNLVSEYDWTYTVS